MSALLGEPTMEELRVLLCESSGLLRHGLKAAVQRAEGMMVVTETGGGTHLLAAVEEAKVDVVMLDPAIVGEKTVGILAGMGVKVLVFVEKPSSEEAAVALRQGALAYLVKDELPPALVPAVIELAMAGQAVIHPQTARSLGDRAHRRSNIVCKCGRRVSLEPKLTPREEQVYRYIHDGLGNAEIARALRISQATVKTHVTHIFEKLGVSSRIELLCLENGHGTSRDNIRPSG